MLKVLSYMVFSLNKFICSNPLVLKRIETLCVNQRNPLMVSKKAPRAWYEKIDQFFLNLSFKHCQPNHVIYVMHVNGETLLVSLNVDYLVITRSNVNLIFQFEEMVNEYIYFQASKSYRWMVVSLSLNLNM